MNLTAPAGLVAASFAHRTMQNEAGWLFRNAPEDQSSCGWLTEPRQHGYRCFPSRIWTQDFELEIRSLQLQDSDTALHGFNQLLQQVLEVSLNSLTQGARIIFRRYSRVNSATTGSGR